MALLAAETARMIPRLSPASIRAGIKWAADERRLTKAWNAVLAFMHRHPDRTTWESQRFYGAHDLRLTVAHTCRKRDLWKQQYDMNDVMPTIDKLADLWKLTLSKCTL